MPPMSEEAFNAAVDARVQAGLATTFGSNEFGVVIMDQYDTVLRDPGATGDKYRELDRARFEARMKPELAKIEEGVTIAIADAQSKIAQMGEAYDKLDARIGRSSEIIDQFA